MTAEEIGATLSEASDCIVLFAKDGLVMAWREGVPYTIDVGERQVRFVARIGRLGEDRVPERLADLMDAQYMFCRTGGFSFSCDSSGGTVRLNHVLSTDGLSADVLMDEFDRVNVVAKAWSARLRTTGTEPEQPADGGLGGTEFRIEV